jgi:hypothetical protein
MAFDFYRKLGGQEFDTLSVMSIKADALSPG